MQTEVNDRPLQFALDDAETAIEVIRIEARLTGTKLVCGTGVCGACTVLVDGVPMASCLLPANHLDGRRVATIEAHEPSHLHPVQRAFLAADALQCGFCTPGFVNEAIAFYDRWRRTNATATPS